MANEFENVLGKVVKMARKRKSLTQQGLAEKINISRNYISDIECGRYIPSVEKLILLADTLDIDLNILKNDGNTIQN
ncbi:helix-turn-helix domain-containing protein [Clostridium neonatale]|uniref:helix-turn-helix domain-containing protein n=1 Tax=Clostridium neonatale TaxID=137838 RepID=UPI00291BC84C|nr:helix-turn-helix transcriptional regulator [Clostridium neonatale]CAI3584375.1 Transcriptional regulator with XRE-family HTH domain [Clostridium neonatale]CAI3617999.1 Transcriptional regulator with XRE-family HTH domain [Clostridium neonatale]